MKKILTIISLILVLSLAVGLLSAFSSGVSGSSYPGKTTATGTTVTPSTDEDPTEEPDTPADSSADSMAPDEPDTEPEPEPQVTMPNLNINDRTLLIGVTVPAATSYDIYVDNVLFITETTSMVDLWDLNLPADTYKIGVVAKADGYLNSPRATIDYTVGGYTVSFSEAEYGYRGDTDTDEETDATLRIFYSKNNFEDLTLNVNSNVSAKYYNVTAVQLQPDTTSKYLYYDMGDLHSYLYHGGSGYASERLHLVNDIDINLAIIEQQCIAADSLILMADGKYKKLGEIKTGDYVLSYDWETMQLVPNKVIYASSEEENWETGGWDAVRYIKHTFSDGTVIKQAFAHRFYNLEAKAFVYLEHWNVGDHTYDQDGDNPYLVKSEVVYETIRYARITLENGTNYFANGLLTGDRNCPSGIILGGESA